MASTRKNFTPIILAASISYEVRGLGIQGFLCSVSGTLRIVDFQNNEVLVNDVPVTAGQYLEIPLTFRSASGGIVTVTTGSGTLFI